MQIYANILGIWTDITNQWNINSVNSVSFIQHNIDKLNTFEFITLRHNFTEYTIHISQIQIKVNHQ